MGKRKRSSQHDNLNLPSSSDDMPCSSGMELLSKEHSPKLEADTDVRDGSVKLLSSSPSVAQHHHDSGRSIFLKRSRRHYRHHYSRRNYGSLAGKISSLQDHKLSFEPAQYNPESVHLADGREKTLGKPERIRSNSSMIDAASAYKVKMICGACQKHLRRKPHFLGGTSASGEYPVVAVLVCGHLYHANCLEERTNIEYRHDPPCPLCLSSLPPSMESSGCRFKSEKPTNTNLFEA